MSFGWRKYSTYIYYSFILIIFLVVRRTSAAVEEVQGGEKETVSRYPVARFEFDHVADIYAITLWILLGSLAKVGKLLKEKRLLIHIYIYIKLLNSIK